MIQKMMALYEHIPREYFESNENEYGLEVKSILDLKVITMCFRTEGKNFFMEDAISSDYDSEKNLTHFFYRKASSNTVSPFLTLYISEEGLKKDKVLSSDSKDYKKFIRILNNCSDQNPDLMGLLEYFKTNSEKVLQTIGRFIEGSKAKPYLFTIQIDGLSIGQSSFFKAIRVQAAEDYFKEFYSLGEKKIVGKDMICSMCRQKHEELWGYVSIYNFYTSKTELAPIAGGMNKEKAHLNYPVCRECASKLKSLKPIVDKYFSFKLCGLDYLLIPEVVGTNKPSSVMDMIVDLMVKQYSESPDAMLHLESRLGELKLGKRKKLIDSQSKEVFDYLSETGNYAAYTMLFYQRNNAEFKILSTIEDVFPSQFQAIFSAKERAESHEIFKELPGSDSRTTYDMEFRIDLIREFIPINHKIEGDFTKSFLEVTRNIFLQKPLSCDFMMSRFITIIRHKFVNDENFELSARKAYLVILFLTELGILDSSQSKDIMEVTMTGKYAEFFEEHKSFFNSYSKQYVFLTGVLTQYLLNIQKANTGATPFRKRLNGMKLDKALVNRILTEAIEKLKQYDKNYYQALEADIAELMIQAAEEKLTNDETSYVFTLGMTLSKRFKENYNSDNTELGGDND